MHATSTTAATPPVRSARTLALLHAPIPGLLLRLAGPNVLVMLAQASTGLIEAHFIGRLGTPALAGVALVFPGLMLMQMMSAGGMGGGISSAIARALGAGRRADADALVLHALAVSAGLGAAFCALGLLGGPALYRAMGGDGAALGAALQYSNVVFAGAVLLWVFNGLASCIRGTGDMLGPAIVIVGGAVVLVPLSPCLIFGWGPFPALGVAGGGVALLLYYGVGAAVFLARLCGAGAGVRLRLHRLRAAPLWAILRVGLVASLVTVQTNLVVTLTTAYAGLFGAAAIAGYGAATRLEFLLVPLVFGLGAPLVAAVGANIGAGQRARALRVAWTGAGVAFVMTEAIGLCAATWPGTWLGWFGQDPAMLQAGAAYLRTAGPFFGFFGGGDGAVFRVARGGAAGMAARGGSAADGGGGGRWLAGAAVRGVAIPGVLGIRCRAGGAGGGQRGVRGGRRMVQGETGLTDALYYEDLQVGEVQISAPHTMTRDRIIAFGEEFDPQPQHLGEDAARSSMFGELVASGWHTAATTMRLQLGLLMGRFPGGTLGAQVDTLTWRRPVRPGDELRAQVEVLSMRPSVSRPDRGVVTLKTMTLNQRDEVVQEMTASVLVPRRPA